MTAANHYPRKRTRLLVAVTGAAALSALVGCALLWRARTQDDPDDLLRRVTLTVPAHVWRGGRANYNTRYGGYHSIGAFWLNNRDILRFTAGGGVLTPEIINTETGGARPVPGLGALARKQYPVSVSPDGKWLLCADRTVSPGHAFSVALDGSGAARREWKGALSGETIYWFRDSRRWASVTKDPKSGALVARVYGFDAHVPRPVRLPGKASASELFPGGLSQGDHLLRGEYGGVVMAGVPAKSVRGRGRNTTETVTATRLDPSGGSGFVPDVRAFTIAAPSIDPRPVPASSVLSGAGIAFTSGSGASARTTFVSKLVVFQTRFALVSPTGDRLLWITRQPEIVPLGGLDTLLTRYAPFLRGVSFPAALRRGATYQLRERNELWTTRLDGRGGLHRVGVMIPSTNPGAFTSRTLYDWAWTPDGKRISFTYNDALFTLLVDENKP